MLGLYASVSLLSNHWAAIEAWEPAPAPDALEEPLLKQARGCPMLRLRVKRLLLSCIHCVLKALGHSA